jgi:peptidoglycan hydrolase CwlO-like protein
MKRLISTLTTTLVITCSAGAALPPAFQGLVSGSSVHQKIQQPPTSQQSPNTENNWKEKIENLLNPVLITLFIITVAGVSASASRTYEAKHIRLQKTLKRLERKREQLIKNCVKVEPSLEEIEDKKASIEREIKNLKSQLIKL